MIDLRLILGIDPVKVDFLIDLVKIPAHGVQHEPGNQESRKMSWWAPVKILGSVEHEPGNQESSKLS